MFNIQPDYTEGKLKTIASLLEQSWLSAVVVISVTLCLSRPLLAQVSAGGLPLSAAAVLRHKTSLRTIRRHSGSGVMRFANLQSRGLNLESQDLSIEKPPLNPVRIAGELAAGTAAGYAGAILAAQMATDFGEWSLYFICGQILGSATGVYLAGNLGDEKGSFLASLVGDLSGVCLYHSAVYVLGTIGAQSGYNNPLSILFWWLSGPIGAAVLFNKSRAYDSVDTSAPLLEVKGAAIGLSIPGMYYRSYSPNLEVARTIDIVRVSF